MKEKIYLSSPHMGGKEEEYVKQAFQTNWIAPLGPHVSGFENELEAYLGKYKYLDELGNMMNCINEFNFDKASEYLKIVREKI